jgi:hypothetical protein
MKGRMVPPPREGKGFQLSKTMTLCTGNILQLAHILPLIFLDPHKILVEWAIYSYPSPFHRNWGSKRRDLLETDQHANVVMLPKPVY